MPFLKVSLILSDLIVKILTNQYVHIYPSEMAPLIKVKFIIKVKGQFGQIINPK